MSAESWQDTIELPPATTWLLEASAGTGKTFQIANLFVRLVAEYAIPVEKILAITFTKAATAELRDRVRTRLRDALSTVREPASATGDVVFAHLLSLGRPEELEKLLELALRSFDNAPISTIHGFSQRMLQELAFDSGQDPDLELLADVGEVLGQIVDDTLASLYARASSAEVTLLAAAGVTRAALLQVARAMTGATAPLVVPACSDDLPTVLARASAWLARTQVLNEQWNGDGEKRALAELEEDAQGKQFKGIQAGWMDASVRDVGAWLEAGAGPCDKTTTAFRRLRTDNLRDAFKGSPEALAGRAWLPLLEELDQFCEDHERVWRELSPLAAFAGSVRERVETELERRRVLTFDGMLSRLAVRVAPDGGEQSALAARIRERFDAVFVDEFQDTDEAQWRVLEAAFHRHRRLFLLGDAKQAIYAFRGADVHVYLQAKGVVDPPQQRTMANNWRSDPQAVAAMNALWRADSGAFDQENIDYVSVSAQKADRLDPKTSGLEIRWVDARVVGGMEGQPISKKVEPVVTRLAAREAVAWLRGERSKILQEDGAHDAQPADLAVLVNSHHEAQAVREALRRVGVPSVAASKDSVLETAVASWLAAWLDAVAGGGRDREARTAVVTPLFGWTADELAWALAIADRGEETRDAATNASVVPRDWNAWTERLRSAAERWPKHGFARTFDREALENDVYARVLALPEGERHATDLRHLFELVLVEERTHRSGPGALADWLRAGAGVGAEETAQRLESDARAVTIETVHASKGLEYPVVLLPFAWSARKEDDGGGPLAVRGVTLPELHVELVGTDGRAEAHARYCGEQRREGLRKVYVALTRAKHNTVVWYGPIGSAGSKTNATPLGRLLMRDPIAKGFDDAAMPAFGKDQPDAWARAKARLDALVDRSKASISWSAEGALQGALASWTPPPPSVPTLTTAAWPAGRPALFGPWVVTSYSRLAAGSAAPDRDEKQSGNEPQPVEEASVPVVREREADPVSLPKPALGVFPELPRLSMGGGTAYGSWVHGALEELDFRGGLAKDGRSIHDVLSRSSGRYGFATNKPLLAELEGQLPLLLRTPLDSTRAEHLVKGLPPGFALGDLERADRLDELPFDLRVGDGTAWRRDLTARAIDRESLDRRPGCADPDKVYEAILFSTDDRRRGVAAWLGYLDTRRAAGKALIGSFAGILTGSIDLVFRAADKGVTRYFLADYKTNRIGTSAPGHYAGDWLEWEMATTGYLLQSLLYTLALHRHLRTRLGGAYDYNTHVGGFVYLFLRGMSGPDTPRDGNTGHCLGVFGDRWPKEVVEALEEAISPTNEVAL